MLEVLAVDYAPAFSGRSFEWVEGCALRSAACRLRYDVYCVEFGYLDEAQSQSGVESDRYDLLSAHVVALNLEGGVSGYVRLVPGGAFGQMPFQSHGLRTNPGVALAPASESAEISRLMVSRRYRRRRGDHLSGVVLCEEEAGLTDGERRASSPQILMCMYREMYRYSKANGIRYWYASMERYLAFALKGMGFAFEQIGPYADYYGPVAPFFGDLRKLEQNLSRTAPTLLEWLQLDH